MHFGLYLLVLLFALSPVSAKNPNRFTHINLIPENYSGGPVYVVGADPNTPEIAEGLIQIITYSSFGNTYSSDSLMISFTLDKDVLSNLSQGDTLDIIYDILTFENQNDFENPPSVIINATFEKFKPYKKFRKNGFIITKEKGATYSPRSQGSKILGSLTVMSNNASLLVTSFDFKFNHLDKVKVKCTKSKDISTGDFTRICSPEDNGRKVDLQTEIKQTVSGQLNIPKVLL